MPRRSSGPISTRATSFSRSGTPRSVFSTTFSMSATLSKIAAAAHHELELGEFDGAPADVGIARPDGLAHPIERNAQRAQPVRIDHDRILLDEAADAGDLGDALRLGRTEADHPVLQRAQLGERHLLGDDGVLVDPADAGRVRPEGRRHASRQALRGGVEIFEHAASRPIGIGAVLEDHVDEGDAEEGEAAHHLRLRHRQHGRRERIGDLVLDDLRRLARIVGVDDHLHVGEVGDGVER